MFPLYLIQRIFKEIDTEIMNIKTIGIAVVLIGAVLIGGFVFMSQESSNQTAPVDQITPVSQTPAGSCDASPTKELVMTGRSDLGNYLANSKCMTLYVTSADVNGVSSCYDECAKNWPPFAYENKDLRTMTGDFYKLLNVIKRTDGTYQYSYGKTPLYFYKGDAKAGDMKGNGLNSNAWSVILLDKQVTQ